jgi:hypothetical protein
MTENVVGGTSGEDRLPILSPRELDAIADPSTRIVAMLEPATRLLAEAVTVAEADELRAEANAIAAYVRTRKLAEEARLAAEVLTRRAEVRIGELLPQALVGAHYSASEGGELRPNERHAFRTMAAARPIVEEALADGITSRSGIMRAIGDRRNKAIQYDGSPAAHAGSVVELLGHLASAHHAVHAFGMTFAESGVELDDERRAVMLLVLDRLLVYVGQARDVVAAEAMTDEEAERFLRDWRGDL